MLLSEGLKDLFFSEQISYVQVFTPLPLKKSFKKSNGTSLSGSFGLTKFLAIFVHKIFLYFLQKSLFREIFSLRNSSSGGGQKWDRNSFSSGSNSDSQKAIDWIEHVGKSVFSFFLNIAAFFGSFSTLQEFFFLHFFPAQTFLGPLRADKTFWNLGFLRRIL